MINYKRYIAVILLVFYTSLSFCQDDKSFDSKFFIHHSDTLNYRILMPKNFDASKQYPVVLMLHGAGERGSDNIAQLTHGSKLFTTKESRRHFQSIVIFPQCPKDSYWANVQIDRSSNPLVINFPSNTTPTKPMALVMALLDDMVLKSYVNKNQIYVGGLSMGGMGTFEILYRKPELFAAAIAICGAGNPENTKEYAKSTPLWVFHGANDNVIDPQESLNMVSGILKYGGKPNFTLYAKDNHNSWDSAFAEPELLSWLFSNIKN
ncbi:prolyl oligopeptidase family serine peptidase [Tamlana sp. 2_MG-2023]|uniref:carboxylesterase family protein n=1 Tax=unclassified Tamlana TaxID=2614803 RepID=UPI0026E455A5|nr:MULTISPECIES: prolyl oligopeptidase family serine peptidase [unclassified Tamlana]MDO6760000.1 prolyl oligopeptidase family serine peptidase [Tamlana sp. 2_MG-2023]MDO6791830.1 prolyl oligopeptidase family serine peptidase [Tamlana sp. 1_MG-2023]